MYKNILFAVEFSNSENLAGQQAKQLAKCFQAKLSLIHAVELPSMDIFPEHLNKDIIYLNQAREQLAEIAANLSIPAENQYIEMGNPKVIIPSFVAKHNIDLLIVGHHERHGMYHLLGSTAQALLSHAKCAVLVLPYASYL